MNNNHIFYNTLEIMFFMLLLISIRCVPWAVLYLYQNYLSVLSWGLLKTFISDNVNWNRCIQEAATFHEKWKPELVSKTEQIWIASCKVVPKRTSGLTVKHCYTFILRWRTSPPQYVHATALFIQSFSLCRLRCLLSIVSPQAWHCTSPYRQLSSWAW